VCRYSRYDSGKARQWHISQRNTSSVTGQEVLGGLVGYYKTTNEVNVEVVTDGETSLLVVQF
jgi:hypothetical protein